MTFDEWWAGYDGFYDGPKGAAMAAWNAALEAARMCEHNASLYPYLGTGWESSIECADAIRALKEKHDE